MREIVRWVRAGIEEEEMNDEQEERIATAAGKSLIEIIKQYELHDHLSHGALIAAFQAGAIFMYGEMKSNDRT